MSALELAAILSPLCTVAVAYVGRARLERVEERVDGHLDAQTARLRELELQLLNARLAQPETPPLD